MMRLTGLHWVVVDTSTVVKMAKVMVKNFCDADGRLSTPCKPKLPPIFEFGLVLIGDVYA